MRLKTTPNDINRLQDLKEIEAEHQELTGEIPEAVGKLSNLKILNLADNDLSRNVPPSLELLNNLEFIELAGNKSLTGNLVLSSEHLQFVGIRDTAIKNVVITNNDVSSREEKQSEFGLSALSTPLRSLFIAYPPPQGTMTVRKIVKIDSNEIKDAADLERIQAPGFIITFSVSKSEEVESEFLSQLGVTGKTFIHYSDKGEVIVFHSDLEKETETKIQEVFQRAYQVGQENIASKVEQMEKDGLFSDSSLSPSQKRAKAFKALYISNTDN